MKWIITGILLLILSVEDGRDRQISLVWILAMAATDGLFWSELTVDFLLGLLPGGIFLAVSLVAKDHLGIGDGFVLLSLGAGFVIRHVMNILLLGSLSFFLYIAGALVFGKPDVNTRHHFLIFVGIGYVIEMLICWAL